MTVTSTASATTSAPVGATKPSRYSRVGATAHFTRPRPVTVFRRMYGSPGFRRTPRVRNPGNLRIIGADDGENTSSAVDIGWVETVEPTNA